jgi:hypothetical protein
MTRPFRALTLPALALGTLLGSGCGPSSTNEENVVNTRAPGAENAKTYKTYGEKVLADTAELNKKRAAAKGAKGQPAATPKAQPADASAPAETPK